MRLSTSLLGLKMLFLVTRQVLEKNFGLLHETSSLGEHLFDNFLLLTAKKKEIESYGAIKLTVKGKRFAVLIFHD